eukprot:SAG22_NODE_5367_length_1027_cov_1.742457_2_plen_186_part_01
MSCSPARSGRPARARPSARAPGPGGRRGKAMSYGWTRKGNGWIDGSVDRWIDGSMCRWIDGSMDRWIDGSMAGSRSDIHRIEYQLHDRRALTWLVRSCGSGTAWKGAVLDRKTVEAQQKGSAVQLTMDASIRAFSSRCGVQTDRQTARKGTVLDNNSSARTAERQCLPSRRSPVQQGTANRGGGGG